MVDMHGGWHDADYGKYILTAAEALKDLVDGWTSPLPLGS